MSAEVPQVAPVPLRNTARTCVLLALILLAAASLRIYRLNEKSFWFDEFASVELPMGRGYAHYTLPDNVVIEKPPNLTDPSQARPIRTLWYSEQAGHLPPLYVVVIRLWGEVFGFAQGSIRAFSVLTSVLAIGVLFLAVRELSGTTAAMWAALLMALAGPQIQYGQEARNYALLLLEGLGAIAALARIERRGPTKWREGALIVCVLAMTLTHYFSIGAILALAVYALIALRARTRIRVIGCFAIAAILWGVLGAPLALRHRHNLEDPRSTGFVQDDSPGHLARTAKRITLLPVRYFTEPMSNSVAPAVVGAAGFVLAILLPLRGRRDLLLWALWLWLTILPLVALDIARRTSHLDYIRYTLLASPAMYAIVASALADSRVRWMRHTVPALVAIACVLAVNAAYSAWWKADWRVLAAAIDRDAKPGDVIVFWRGPNYEAYPNAAFLHTTYYRRSPLGPIVLMQRPPDAALAEQLRRAPGVLVISLTSERADDAVPSATLQWRAFEPGAGGLWRATWNSTMTPRNRASQE
jgi:mannosyltransferase